MQLYLQLGDGGETITVDATFPASEAKPGGIPPFTNLHRNDIRGVGVKKMGHVIQLVVQTMVVTGPPWSHALIPHFMTIDEGSIHPKTGAVKSGSLDVPISKVKRFAESNRS
jgi:hypothetical protein